MAKLGIVDPREWLYRTRLGIGRGRGELLKRADKAYAEYFKLRSEANKKKLHQALKDYLIEKGKHWENVRRNTKSEGLMAYVYESTRDAPVKKNVLERRIPESRHGVLYLWQRAHVETQWAKIALEGALTVASNTASMLQASSYSDGESLQSLGVIAKDSGLDKAINYAGYADKAAGALGLKPSPQGTGVQVQSKLPPPPPELPQPFIKLNALGNDPTVIERAKHYFGTAFNTVYNAIRKAVLDIFDALKRKYQSVKDIGFVDTFGAGNIGGAIASLINFILGKVVKHVAPLAGNAIEIAQGIAKSIIAAKDRIIAYKYKSHFVIAPGHPLRIGLAIEREMNWAIASGVYNVAKGGAKLAGNIASWGASALIDVIAACVELAWKFISRLFESRGMSRWITEVKERTGNRNTWRADPLDGKWRPAVVYDDKEFLDLFERGCSASPCIPMITLNSGIAGDQMMFMKIFDDTGGILRQGSGISSSGDKPTEAAQKEFDAATKYWTHLKHWGRNYLEGTGFTFTSDDEVARGLMWHAIAHHKAGSSSNVDKALHMLAGA